MNCAYPRGFYLINREDCFEIVEVERIYKRGCLIVWAYNGSPVKYNPYYKSSHINYSSYTAIGEFFLRSGLKDGSVIRLKNNN